MKIFHFALIAQLVEHRICNAGVGSSSLSWSTYVECSSVG